MRHLLSCFALIGAGLIAPVAVQAAPLICNGPSGLVYVLQTSCAAANVGVFPGFTVGDCLVVQADLSFGDGTCGGGGGGPTLAGNNVFTGMNTFNNATLPITLGTSGTPGTFLEWGMAPTVGGTFASLGSSLSTTVAGITGSAMLITNVHNGNPLLALDRQGRLGIGANIDGLGSLVISGQISAGGRIDVMSSTVGGNGTPVPPTYYLDGATAVAQTYHCVTTPNAGLTASGASTNVVLAGLAVFMGTGYTLTINDNGPTGFSNPAVTEKSPTDFTFTSTNFATDTYSYNACGE
jgi:hypothetical protein